eukprot:gene23992-29109_t
MGDKQGEDADEYVPDFTNTWQLLGGEEYDPTHFFGTLAARHQGNFLRAVIKNCPEIFSLIEKEDHTTLDLSRENQFTLRILEASKGHNEDEGEVNFTAEGLQNHEESAKKFEEASKDVYENESDEEAEDLANDNFLASVKVHRMTTRKTGEFTAREIEQARKQIRTHLLRHHLDIAVLSVTGKKYRNQLKPFIHVKVAAQTEAASLDVKLAVLDVDDVGYSITPKSHRCTSFHVTFKANKANCQPTLSNITEFLKTTVFGKYINDIPFYQSCTEGEKLTH